MKTANFFQRIIKTFKAVNTQNEQNHLTGTADNNPKDTDSNNTPTAISSVNLTPTVVVNPATQLVSMASTEIKNIETRDLASWAMEKCLALNGNIHGLTSLLDVVLMNYKLEAKTLEEELKVQRTNTINSINDEIIELNNRIAIINEFHIPEKENHIKYLDEQLSALENNKTYDLNTELGSETYTILSVSKARTREIIRKLQSQIVELKTQIQQKEIRINTLKLQMESINLFNKEIVLRRMNIFLDGWLTGLEGMGAPQSLFDETRNVFNKYRQQIENDF